MEGGYLQWPSLPLWTSTHPFRVSIRDKFAPKGTFDNVWSHFWLSQLGDATGRGQVALQVEAKDAVEHPTVHRTTPVTKKDPASDINSVTHNWETPLCTPHKWE